MLLGFVSEKSGELRADIDLKAYEKHSNRKVSDVTVQELCKLHPRIQTIRLDDCDISDVALWSIAKHSPLVTGVFLSGCMKITNVGLRSFSLTCSSLRSIDLSRCRQLDDIGLSSIAAGCWELRDLKLSHCPNIGDDGLSTVTACRQLESLDVEGCTGVGDFGSRVLKGLGRHCSQLRAINFLGCKRVEDAGLQAVARGCPRLETFWASGGATVTAKGLKVFLGNTSALKSLRLRDCSGLSDADLRVSLEARDCLVSGLRDEEAARLPAGRTRRQFLAAHRDSLVELDISGAESVSDKGVQSLAKSSLGASLLTLGLAQCRLTDQSSTHVVDNMTRLRNLDLSFCPLLTDTSVHNIALGVTAISTLKLNSNDKISMAALIGHIGEKLPFANLAKNWVGYEPKPDYLDFIRNAELHHLQSSKAVLIQSVVRRKIAYTITSEKRRFWLIDRHIPRAQALVRGYQQRRRYRRKLDDFYKNRMATRIQCYYRKFVHTVRIERRLKAKRWLHFQIKLSRLIQRIYRGMIGRRRARRKRDDLANLSLKEARLQAKRELKAGVIQRHYRGRLGRMKACDLRLKQQLERARLAHEDNLCRLIQRVLRGMIGRRLAAQIRLDLQGWKCRWFKCLLIQKAFRGHGGRRKAALMRMKRENDRRLAATLQVQRVYRGFKGYLKAKAVKEVRRLDQLKSRASKNIQKLIRGHLARMTARWLLEKARLNNRMSRGALLFQRLYRGHKGRESCEIERELIKFEEAAKPLYIMLQKNREETGQLSREIAILAEEISRIKEEITESELELASAMQNKEKYIDSFRLNKTPQRFVTKYLRVRLKDYIIQNTELLHRKNGKLNGLQSSFNELSRMTRKINRELVPLTTGCITKVKIERGKRLRALVRRKNLSAVLIQKKWRGHIIRKGYTDAARDYWIPCTDEDQSEHTYYYNTWTQETSWFPPFIFRYISKPNTDTDYDCGS